MGNGAISNLSDQQERLKALMLDDSEKDTYAYAMREILVAQPIDEVVNCAIIHAEMVGKLEADHGDILWAAEFLDHLDTIGWKITPKTRQQRRELPRMQTLPDLSTGESAE